MAGIKWSKNFHATLATPVTAWDLAFGLLIWSSIRILLVTAIFGLVSILFGAFSPMEGAVAVLPAT